VSHYTTLYSYGESVRDFWDVFIYVSFFFKFEGDCNATIILFALVGYEMIITNSIPMLASEMIVNYKHLEFSIECLKTITKPTTYQSVGTTPISNHSKTETKVII